MLAFTFNNELGSVPGFQYVDAVWMTLRPEPLSGEKAVARPGEVGSAVPPPGVGRPARRRQPLLRVAAGSCSGVPSRSEGGEFGLPPGPGCPFERVAGRSLPLVACRALRERHFIEVVGAGPLPAPALDRDQAGRGEPAEDGAGLGCCPAHQLRSLHGRARFAEASVQVACLEPQPLAWGEGVVGAGLQPVVEFTEQQGAEGGAGVGGARVRL